MSKVLSTPHDEFMDAERAWSLFIYDPATGIFLHRNTRQGVVAGSRAGSLKSDGYRYIEIQERRHSEHRLAWLYVMGEWPVEIDHRNRIRHDNRFLNLRDADRITNNLNRGPRRHRSAHA